VYFVSDVPKLWPLAAVPKLWPLAAGCCSKTLAAGCRLLDFLAAGCRLLDFLARRFFFNFIHFYIDILRYICYIIIYRMKKAVKSARKRDIMRKERAKKLSIKMLDELAVEIRDSWQRASDGGLTIAATDALHELAFSARAVRVCLATWPWQGITIRELIDELTAGDGVENASLLSDRLSEWLDYDRATKPWRK
jgi:hypothetical protein